MWWLLGLLVALALGTAIVLFVRRRRARKAWETQLAGAVAESTWLAHELLPAALSTENAVTRRDVWLASRPRVGALENRLNQAMASAPADRLGSLAQLRDAVTDVGSTMDTDAATAALGDRESVGAARQAQRQLENALRAFEPPPET
ncbi:MAG TPA: hypothetical protein VGS60_18155 [Actinomycetes bacterium]|nr:hypothetical protein [Actinomycetes bacterium]